MKVEGFSDYRMLFYYFQYAFASRGGLLYDLYDQSNLLNIMNRLAHEHDYFHFENEYLEPVEPPSSRKNKPPQDMAPDSPLPINSGRLTYRQHKQLKKLYGGTGVTPSRYTGTILFTATSESPHRHLMLYQDEWLKNRSGAVWNDYTSLYRALVIFDLFQDGETAESICDKYGNLLMTEELPSKGKIIIHTDISSGVMLTIVKQMLTSPRDPIYFLKEQFTDKNPFITMADDIEYKPLLIRRINSHYARAKQLIQLATSGAFKTFPQVLTPLK